MDWTDIAAIVFASTTVNHLGLISAIERVLRHRLIIINCPKCLTFWLVLVCGVSGDGMAANPSSLIRLAAISVFSAYLAVWLELAEGITDRLYSYIYDKVFPATDNTPADAA